jgi:succinoglycan biosynthesis protein ExoA
MKPHVSVIIPARNEAAHIRDCLDSVMAQQVEGGLEVIVADGKSSDGTAELARATGATVVENPNGSTPAGLNAALAAAKGDIVLRFDAHGRMPPGYVAASVRALEEERGAVGVGGWVRVDPSGPWGRAVGAALSSRLGIGNPRSWREPPPDQRRVDVETFPLGCWPTGALRAAGGWNERLVRNQDYELNYRLRRAGGRIIYDPAVWSFYRPRESLGAIARQYWEYGRFKALTLMVAPASVRPRQLAPLGLLGAAATALLPFRVAVPARIAVGGYVVLVAGITVRLRGGWRTMPVLVTMHTVWGAGVVAGAAQVARSRLGARAFQRFPKNP